jgi:hypothetical protein
MMPKIGLALSGGDFRGTLYHLGVVRFLRDAGILRDITHITSVSGGSILAAHLVLNWDRYNGSPQEFEYELPASPELHMLSTNLSEGCLCSYTRSGLIMQRRLPGDRVQFERIQAGLATVPMAVTASSAFPGFFPPMTLRSSDVGASEAAFSQQTFTDGGVFDNLGIRAFRFIERCWSEECRPTDADGREMEVEKNADATTIDAHAHAHAHAHRDRADVPPREAAPAPGRGLVEVSDGGGGGNARRRELVRMSDLERGGDHASVMPEQPGPEDDEREFHEAFSRGAPRQTGDRPTSAAGFDVVLTSDAGAKLITHHDSFNGGLVRTAMRASDILVTSSVA